MELFPGHDAEPEFGDSSARPEPGILITDDPEAGGLIMPTDDPDPGEGSTADADGESERPTAGPTDDRVADGDGPVEAKVKILTKRGRSPLVLAAVAGAVVAAALFTLASGGAGDPAGADDESETAAEDDDAGLETEVPDGVSFMDGSATAMGDEVRAAARLVVSVPDVGIDVVGFDGAEDRPASWPEPANGGLVSAGEAVVYIGADGLAWRASIGQPPEPIGTADVVRDSGAAGLVWLGELVDNPQSLPSYNWSEVDLDGAVRRTAIRQEPLEFPSPALVWGVNSTIWRLTESENRPWARVAQGYPVAAGHNDVIIRICEPTSSENTLVAGSGDEEVPTADPEPVGRDGGRDCDRLWFDTGSGEIRDPILNDVADSLPVGFGGRISPDGRFLLVPLSGRPNVPLISVSDGEVVTDACLEVDSSTWLTEPAMLACRTAGGVSVFDLDGGGRFDLDLPRGTMFALIATG